MPIVSSQPQKDTVARADPAHAADPAFDEAVAPEMADDSLALDDPQQLVQLVNEIKDRLADVVAREQDVDRRESELSQRWQELEAGEQRAAANESSALQSVGRGDLAAETANLRRRRAELARRISSARQAIARQRTSVADDRTAVDEQARVLEHTRVELTQAIDDLAQEREQLERHSARIAAERESLALQTAQMDQKRGELVVESDRVQSRAADLNRLQTEIDGRLAELNQRVGILERRESELDVLRAELESRATALGQRDAELERWRSNQGAAEQQELEQRRAAVDKLYAQATQFEQRARERFEEAGRAKQQLVAKSAEAGELRDRLDAARLEIETETARLRTDRDTHALLEAELTRRRGAFERDIAALRRRMEEIATEEAEAALARAENERVREELDATSRGLDQRDVALAQREAEIAEREEQAAQRSAQAESRAGELAREEAQRRERLAEMLARETEVAPRLAALAEAQADFDRRAADLTARQNRLDEQTLDLARRAAEIERSATEQAAVAAKELTERRAAVDKLYLQATQLEQRAKQRFEEGGAFKQQLVARAGELKEYRKRLDTARLEIETETARLKADRDTHSLLEAELARRREACELEALELTGRADALTNREAEIDRTAVQRQRELDARRAQQEREIEARRADLREEAKRNTREIEKQNAHLEQRSVKLRQFVDALQKQRDDLIDKSHRLRARGDELDGKLAELDKRRRQAESRAAELDARESAWRTRNTQLNAFEGDLTRRDAQLQQSEEALRQRQSALAIAQDAAEKLQAQATDLEQRARLRFEEAGQLQNQLAAKEADVANAGLTMELAREELETERARLIVERDTLNFLQADAQRILREGRPATAEPSPQPAPVAIRRTPAFWGVRALLLSGSAAAIAGYVAWQFDVPRYALGTRLIIASERVPSGEARVEHLHEILADGAAAARPSDPAFSRAWNDAVAGGQIEIAPDAEAGALRLRLTTTDSSSGKELLAAASSAYVAHAQGEASQRFFSPRTIDWKQRRAALDSELADARSRAAEVESRLAKVQGFDAWDEARAAVERTQSDFDRVSEKLATERARLTRLRSDQTPTVEIANEVLAAALADDALYQEDIKEFVSVAREHRMSILLAMLKLPEPLKELRVAVAAARETITKERAQQPPQSAVAVLDECDTRLESFDVSIATVSHEWDERRKAVERLEPAQQPAELLKHQSDAAKQAQSCAVECKALVEWLGGKINGLTQKGDVGTREQVLVSVLRGDLSRISGRVTAVADAAPATELTTSVELEAADRQLRNLRSRLVERRDLVRGDLQRQAEQSARSNYSAELQELDDLVRGLEQRRDELTSEMAAGVAALRGMEQQVQELRDLNAERRAGRDEVQRLEARSTELESQRPAVPPDNITIEPISVAQLSGQNRTTRAVFSAAGAALLTWLMCGLMIVGGRKH